MRIEKEMDEEFSFEELLKSSFETPNRKLFPGDKVSGKVFQVRKDTIFVDLGGKSEGLADIQEFLDQEGHLTVKEGDWVEMRVASIKDEIRLTRGMKVQGPDAFDLIREAKDNLIPIEGRVSKVVKGGFEIDLSGIRAFCPLSQIDLPFCERPEEYVGARYPFRIMEIKEKGKNIIVSRKLILEEEQEKRLQETLARLKPNLECEGKVTRLTDFGAFVDLGGIEGMVHISEMSHLRIKHPSEVIQSGQTVKVKVLKIEEEKEGRPKISLSIKALEPDAWERGLDFKEGEIIKGKVSRLMDFGAFVEVAPGVVGLVHISEMSDERVPHPNRFLREGELIDVMVLGIDHEARRISLSIKEAMIKKRLEKEGAEKPLKLEAGQVLRGMVEDQKPYGLFIRLPQFGPKVKGFLPNEELRDYKKGEIRKRFPKGQAIQVEILSIDSQGKIRLSHRDSEGREDEEDFKKFMTGGETGGMFGTLGDIFKDLKLKKDSKIYSL